VSEAGTLCRAAGSRERNSGKTNVKHTLIYQPIVYRFADIELAMRSGDDLYQRRLDQTRRMLAQRERDIPGFTRHAPPGLSGVISPPDGSRSDA
jgi:hypothetical protein